MGEWETRGLRHQTCAKCGGRGEIGAKMNVGTRKTGGVMRVKPMLTFNAAGNEGKSEIHSCSGYVIEHHT